jgi:hypothetical protein
MQDDDHALPPPTLSDVAVTARGFPDEESANALARCVGQCVGSLSRCFDLDRVDGITIAYDYDDALKELDRGFDATRPLAATKDHGLIGVAMAPPVKRDGVIKVRLMFSAPFVLPLLDEKNEHFDEALYIVAHECGHVQDLKEQDVCFPGRLLSTTYPNTEASTFGIVAHSIWTEYAACRLSAHFAAKDTQKNYDETLAKVLQLARPSANAAIVKYRIHADIARVIDEAGAAIAAPLERAAYLLGHLHGQGSTIEAAPHSHKELEQNPYRPLLEHIDTVLADLWTRHGQWKSFAEFDPLIASVKKAFADGGLIFSTPLGGTTHVKIPFTPETMPAI